MTFRRRALVAALLCSGASSCASVVSAVQTQSTRAAYADFLIARVANLNADHAAAADRYFEALLSEPNSPELLQGAISSSLSAGDVRRARMGARLAEQRGVDAPAARLVRAVDALRDGRWHEARQAAQDFDGDGVDEFAVRLLGIWAEAGAGRADAALTALAAIDAPPPFDALLIQQRALAFDLAGRREEARIAYAAARDSHYVNAPASVREVDLLARLGRTEDLRGMFRDSYGSVRDPDVARALDAAAAGGTPARTPLTPARAAALGVFGLANFLNDQRELDRALPLLTLALMLDPEFDTARLLTAELLRKIKRWEDARAALAAIPETSPYARNAAAQIVWLLRDNGRSEEALAQARANAADGSRIANRTLGDIYRSLGRWAEAEAVYDAMIERIGEPVAADWPIFFVRAVARDRQGRWAEAEADVRRAIALAPNEPQPLNFLGYTLVDRGERLEEGLALIQTALSLNPDSAAIIDSLGWAYFRLGRYEEAYVQLDRAVQIEPADAILNDHLGDVLWRLGRRIEARFQWQRALSLDPEPQEREQIEHKLAEGLPDLSSANAQR